MEQTMEGTETKKNILNGIQCYVTPEIKDGLRSGEGTLQDLISRKRKKRSIEKLRIYHQNVVTPVTGCKRLKQTKDREESPWYNSNK